jgi:6-phosphogluconate dehydrogenase (decarboxylating)
MLPAAIVDKTIVELTPYLAPGDVVIDGGNSHYRHVSLKAFIMWMWVRVAASGGSSAVFAL